MVRDLGGRGGLADVSSAEEELLLASPRRPIVLLRRRPGRGSRLRSRRGTRAWA